jgi:hypothetical protein
MRWFHFILSHSIFISLCAAALCFQTYLLLNIGTDPVVCALVFCATLCGYNLYWLISKYHFSKERKPSIFFKKNLSNVLLFFIAASGVVFCILLRPHAIPQLTIAVLLTGLYSLPLWPFSAVNFLRKAGFMKTLLLSFAWAYVTVMIPVQVSFFEITADVAILFSARFSFMLMLCIIFDARDITVDKLHALRSLATDVSRIHLRVIMVIVFIAYLGAGYLLRARFSTNAQVIAFLITGLATLLVYRMSLKKQGYIFYYFLVDGLMLFSAFATYIASI